MSRKNRARLVEILLVEDNPGDARLTREALDEARLRNHVHVVTDGAEALAFLRRQGRHLKVPRPDLILLDLNLPKKSGHEVLAELKADRDLLTIPVVVLTSSAADEDIDKSYQHHVNSYVVKPVGLDQFLDAVKLIEGFWIDLVTLPPEPRSADTLP